MGASANAEWRDSTNPARNLRQSVRALNSRWPWAEQGLVKIPQLNRGKGIVDLVVVAFLSAKAFPFNATFAEQKATLALP